mmetsp:Transcript_2375/g.2869  ORF Transcript_2375/g.2869 Transcript_2375/m.2869 type:complete len:95 (-) Transcript_2375:2784-3068(-)
MKSFLAFLDRHAGVGDLKDEEILAGCNVFLSFSSGYLLSSSRQDKKSFLSPDFYFIHYFIYWEKLVKKIDHFSSESTPSTGFARSCSSPLQYLN